MILVVDVGNTHTNFALFENDLVIAKWYLPTDPQRTVDKYGTNLLKSLKDKDVDPKKVKGMAISSVVPSVTPALRQLGHLFFKKDPIVVGDEHTILGIKVLLDNPKDVGDDLLVDAIAVNYLYGAPALILDFGTASTFVVTDSQGDFYGGIILPGLRLMMKSLFSDAALLPDVPVDLPSKVIGTNTLEAVQSGVVLGHVDLVNGLIQRVFQEKGMILPVIATGGFSSLLAPHIPALTHIDLDLTLKGIYRVYELNKRN
jgi:type III pantothenate kinase